MNRNFGLNATQLKLIALFCMTLDHLAQFGQEPWGIPSWFRIIGRIAAPLFIFLVAQGARKTHNIRRYLLRLYVFGAAMQAVNTYLTFGRVPNNIMFTMFYIVLLCELFRCFCEASAGKRWLVTAAALGAVLVPCALSLLLAGSTAGTLVSVFVPTVFSVEGGLTLVALGFALYVCEGDVRSSALVFGGFCVLYFALTLFSGVNFAALFTSDIQWLQLLALPLILLYNGKRGAGLKWLFYVYYPAHIYLLYWLSLPRAN